MVEMEKLQKQGVLLRITATALLILTLLLVRFNTQTKVLFLTLVKKATYRDLDPLFVLVWVDLAAAAYNVVHVLICFFFPIKEELGTIYRSLAWASYLVDQGVVYLVFAANSAATEASLLAVKGSNSFQWMKVCNRFTRFCYQVGGALFCGLLASIVLALVSSLSAYRLFRLYSTKQFLLLKKK
ncbi:hypothetical protein M9H77_06331 [Catharanthus roseus]|uniref:Uncharacterized protein n=1 Tax=Catharanthus roseus TaxID=4058 RepID=A0ACC0BRU5_CATRO|nr:hypothetical protein M9H77_06331 [Catharanthus roseus]